MQPFEEVYPIGLEFHGHRCPAMPMGIKAGLAAMKILRVEHSADKELSVISETGKGHAAGCFLDGVMAATGCTYGKSNIEKRYYNKMAFTLIDNQSGRSVRISLKPDFFEKAINSPFVQQRKAGVPPQDIDPEIANPLIEKVVALKDEMFLDIGEIKNVTIEKKQGIFECRRCDSCGEMTFANKLRITPEGKTVCIPCSGYDEG